MKRARIAMIVIVALAMVPGIVHAGPTTDLPPVGWPIVPPSLDPPTAIGTVGPSHPILNFSGAVDNPTPLPLVNDPLPIVCAVFCKEFTFNAATATPFLVSIRNTVTGPDGTFNANDGFVLYVYGPSGTLVGSANGIGADGQALAIDAPTEGMYTIVVTFIYANDPNAAYLGEVRLMSGSTWRPAPCTTTVVSRVRACFDLPVLEAIPAYDLMVSGLPPVASTPLGFPLPVSAGLPTSCYVDESLGLASPSVERLENPTLRCLRFTSNVRNVGAGTLEVRLPWLTTDGTSGFLPGQCNAEQVVFATGGAQVLRPSGPCEFHPAHGHFHYRDLVSYTLYQSGPDGTPGARIGTSRKASFCLADDEYFGFGTAGPNAPRTYVGQPGCNVPADLNDTGAYVVEGVAPGWGDVYTWDTPDQYIDITNLPPGTYALVERTNPNGTLLVAGPSQTCALTELALTDDAVRVLSTRASITCPSA